MPLPNITVKREIVKEFYKIVRIEFEESFDQQFLDVFANYLFFRSEIEMLGKEKDSYGR